MNEQNKAWLAVEYSSSPSLTEEERNRRNIFESIMRQVDSGQLTQQEAFGQIRQRTHAVEHLSRFAIIETSDIAGPYSIAD